MINITEKLELARELNLERQISQLEHKIGMFDLKFKKITLLDMRRRLSSWRFKFTGIPTVCSSFMCFFAFSIFKDSGQFVIIPLVITLCVYLLSSYQVTKINSCWANDFPYELPYGAMLAQKEALEKGILRHRIYYPTWEYHFSLKSDPIMTGEKNGIIYEIFAWNEDDVYD